MVPVFKRYQNDKTLAFEKTDIHLSLVQKFGERLISRSQAKRVIRSLEKFSSVVLDFKGVEAVGQGFVDEIFRVYARRYPKLKITYINAVSDVDYMIKRGISGSPL